MSAPHTFRIKDYTVGLVCALFTELAAAQDMLDERHDDTHVNGLDTNMYTLGSISGHNVVIACLPDGQMGIGPAAAVTAQMKSTFPSIQFGLMVGVGGGVPSAENDIRLGDVVVSRPDKGHGGVVQYDFGKNTPGGFRRTGFLNSPPQVLLKAIANIRSDHLRGENKVMQYASCQTVKIQRPDHDTLFEADSSHIGGSMCEKCDRNKLVNRKPRADQEIVIHYGTIASGSQVMRDGVERDRLSSELGGVLCFEMEAAGLMNILPCLVIRGICDYADSHKNKAWQPYAARMAAAYAKELLSRIPISEVKKPLVTKDKAVHFHLLPGPAICPFESIMTPPHFGWSGAYVATGIQAVVQVMQTLEEDDDSEPCAEADEFLRELKATLKDIQRYESEFPSGQFTADIIRLLQIMKSPLDRFICSVEAYYLTLTVSSQISKSKAGSESKKLSKLFGKIMELRGAICHSLKLLHTLLLLHNLEDVVKVIRNEIPVIEPDATNVAAKLIRALDSIDNTKLDLSIESLRSRQNYEKAIHFDVESSKQDISSTLPTGGRKPRTDGSRSTEMIFAIEVLRQELHRSTGIILDALINQIDSPSNDRDVKDLLALHKQSFVTIHESLKSSWMATNEIEDMIRQWKEQHTTRNISSWITTGAASLLGAVIGTIATTVFGMSLNRSDEPQLCDISSLINERDTNSNRQDKQELCPRCEYSNGWIVKNDALAIGEDSDFVQDNGMNTGHIDSGRLTLPSAQSASTEPQYANYRVTSSSSSAYATTYIHSGDDEESQTTYRSFGATPLPTFAALSTFTPISSGIIGTHLGINTFGDVGTGPDEDNRTVAAHLIMGEVFEEYPSLEGLKSLDEIEQLATRLISKEAWAFNFAASGDLISKRLNAKAYNSILLRPRIFVDVGKWNLSTQIMGQSSGLPIFISPMAMARRFHPAGEAGITQACRDFGIMHIISNNASMTTEEIVDAGPDQPHGFQLYVQQDRKESEAVLARINKLEAIKCLVLTLDEPVPGKHELGGQEGGILGIDDSHEPTTQLKPAVPSISGPAYDLTWKDTLEWVTEHTKLPIVLKGIQTHEDAYIASQFPQVKSIILSNHAGRVLDTAPPAVHTLLEIRKYCPEVFDKVEVLVDGGIRRGTDVVKALCLGAKGVGIGRSVLWGLGAGGIRGVERTIEILAGEIKTCMQLLGVGKVSDLGLQHANTSIIEQQIYKGPSGLECIKVES